MAESNSHPKIICVDFDVTLTLNDAKFPGIGSPRYNVIDVIKDMKRHGWYIILFTCREGRYLREAVDWAAKHGLKFNRINDNAPWIIKEWGYSPRKPYADIYLDDKAVNVKSLDRKG